MRNTLPLIALTSLTLACALPAWAQDYAAADEVAVEEVDVVEEEESTHDFSATLTGVSDYVFRGISQTQGEPAFQASFDYAHASGFYVTILGSSVEFTPDDTLPEDEDGADVEIDYVVGFGGEFNDSFTYAVSGAYYTYPGTNDGVDYDYPELIGQLGWNSLTFSVAYSWDTFNTSENSFYYYLGGEWELPWELTLGAAVGYSDLNDVFDESYIDWQLGMSRSFGFLEVGAYYTDTNSDGEVIFGDLADDRFVLTLSFTID